MPGGSEWIMIIIALGILLAPVILVIYLLKVYLNKKKEKEVIRKL
jgi:flagellar basal body-associated protein FliL